MKDKFVLISLSLSTMDSFISLKYVLSTSMPVKIWENGTKRAFWFWFGLVMSAVVMVYNDRQLS